MTQQIEVPKDTPDKVTLVIDPISKPLEYVKKATDAIGNGFKKMGQGIKKAFTPKKRR